MKYITPVIILFIASCSLFGTETIKKGTTYLIENENESYVFTVTAINYENSGNTLLEKIEYKLYQSKKNSNGTLTSYVKYSRTKTGENSYSLERIEGTDEIKIGTVSFSWSYGSENHIYLYLKNGTNIKKLKV